MSRVVALVVLLALLAGVCPSMASGAPARHGCCQSHSGGCPSLGAVSCCAPQPGEASSSSLPSAPTSPRLGSDAPVSLVLAPPPAVAARVVGAVPSHGLLPVPPLLRSCLRRV